MNYAPGMPTPTVAIAAAWRESIKMQLREGPMANGEFK
jgi:hypothetical protein